MHETDSGGATDLMPSGASLPAAQTGQHTPQRLRTVSRRGIGLTMLMPEGWTEQIDGTASSFSDPAGSTELEVSGSARLGLNLVQWNKRCLDGIAADMGYLRHTVPGVPIVNPAWGKRIAGIRTEFAGSFPERQSRAPAWSPVSGPREQWCRLSCAPTAPNLRPSASCIRI